LVFSVATGKLVVTLDADLQDDISELPRLLQAHLDGADLVVGWKRTRFDNEPHKAIPSWFFNGLIFLLFGLRLHDVNCGLRLMIRDVAKSLHLYGGFYRFIPVLAHLRGFSVREVSVQHRKREHGHSKYGPRRFWTGLLDLLAVRFVTAFSERPLHLYGSAALVIFILGVGLEIYVLTMKLLGDQFSMHLAALIIGTMLILVAVQILTTGLIGVMFAASRKHELQRFHVYKAGRSYRSPDMLGATDAAVVELSDPDKNDLRTNP
jgi:glycosyltransferase involved in cell wall biosynthesis